MSEAERIDALKRHPILRKVLAELPDDKRESVLRCILLSKRDYPLSPEEEDEAFAKFADAALDYIDEIIDRVMDALE